MKTEEVCDRQEEAAREPAAVLQVFYFELNVLISSSNIISEKYPSHII